MKKRRIIKNMCLWMIGFGFLLLIGTAGSSDMEVISLSALSNQNLAASVLLILGAIGNRYMNQMEAKQCHHRVFKNSVPVKIQKQMVQNPSSSPFEIQRRCRPKKKSSYIAV